MEPDDIDTKVAAYKEEGATFSPIWIWFQKSETTENQANCMFCKAKVPRKMGSTGCMTNHLKKQHGFMSIYNAWKIFEELSQVKEQRLKAAKRKNSVTGYLGEFHDQGDAKWIVIRRPLRVHNDIPFGRPTPGRPIGCPGLAALTAYLVV
jgi:hypothetical protein